MEYLKKKIIEEIHDIEREVESSGKFREEQLHLIYKLAKTHYYLEKLSNHKTQSATTGTQSPIMGSIQGVR